MDASVLNRLSKSAKAKLLTQVKELKKQQEAALSPGYVERKLHIPMDSIGRSTELSEEELLEQKSYEYKELIESDAAVAALVSKVEAEGVPQKPLTRNQREYAHAKPYREAKAKALAQFAREILSHLNRESDPSTGKAPRLTPFEREVVVELKEMQLLGIEVPFYFPGKKDSKLEALKNSFENSKAEATFRAMSSQEYSRYEKAAKLILSMTTERSTKTGELKHELS